MKNNSIIYLDGISGINTKEYGFLQQYPKSREKNKKQHISGNIQSLLSLQDDICCCSIFMIEMTHFFILEDSKFKFILCVKKQKKEVIIVFFFEYKEINYYIKKKN